MNVECSLCIAAATKPNCPLAWLDSEHQTTKSIDFLIGKRMHEYVYAAFSMTSMFLLSWGNSFSLFNCMDTVLVTSLFLR